MVIYTCEICNKKFKKKSHYIDHVQYKKKPCEPKEINEIKPFEKPVKPVKLVKPFENIMEIKENKEEIDIKLFDQNTVNVTDIIKKYQCQFCGYSFTRKDNLSTHIKKVCKVKKLENEKKENILNNLVENELLKENNKHLKKLTELLQKQNEELNKKNEELNKKINSVLRKNNKIINNTQLNNSNNTNNTNITNIMINPLNAFGKENLKSIKADDFIKIVTDTKNTGKHCINKLVDLIHFNSDIPENMNVYMSDFNREKYMVYDGEKWVLNQNGELLAFEILEHLCKLYNLNKTTEFTEKLKTDKIFARHFNVTFKKYFNCLFDEDSDISEEELKKHNEFKQMIENEIIVRLYNNKTSVIDSYKKNYDSDNNLLDLE